MMRNLIAAMAILIFVQKLAVGQTTVSLEQALELAEAQNPRLAGARAQLEGASSAVVTARQLPNPEVEASSGSVRARVPGVPTGAGTNIGFSQLIELPSVRSSRARAAEAGRAISVHGLALARLEVRAAVKQAYYDVLQRKAELNLAIDTESLLEQIRNRLEVRFRVGEAPKFELTRADAELARARTVSASARLRVSQSIVQLRTAIGAPLAELVDVAPRDLQNAILPPAVLLRAEIEANHPSLSQARADVAHAQSRLENERALRTPQPTLIGGVERQPELNQFLIGVAIPLPLFNQRQGQIGEAQAALDGARVLIETRRIELLGSLDVAVRRADIARQQISAYEGGLIKQAESALAIADAAYRLGERGFIEVLDAQRVLRQVRTELLAAQFELQSALIEIERLRAAEPLKEGS